MRQADLMGVRNVSVRRYVGYSGLPCSFDGRSRRRQPGIEALQQLLMLMVMVLF